MFSKPHTPNLSFHQVASFKHLCNYNNGSYTVRYQEKSKVMLLQSSFNPVLSSVFPSKTYYERLKEDKTTVHLGQRKLLFAEFQLLIPLFQNQSTKQIIVVYVGAGPGQHINILIKCFPTLKWKLIDPAFAQRPDKGLLDYQRKGICEILPVFFTDELAHKIKDECKDCDIVYISDIRKKDEQDDFPSNECIKEDMEDQCRWYKILQPIRSQFKFRLPWIDEVNETNKEESTEYLKGDIHFPIWGKPSTTESRLIVEGPNQPIVAYNNLKYQEQMFYFNSEHRISCFDHPITERLFRDVKKSIHPKKTVHYCHCHDCKSEIEILYSLISLSLSTDDICVDKIAFSYDKSKNIFYNIVQIGTYISEYLHQFP